MLFTMGRKIIFRTKNNFEKIAFFDFVLLSILVKKVGNPFKEMYNIRVKLDFGP